MYPTSPTYITQATAQTRRPNVRLVAYVGSGLVEHIIEPLSVEFSDKREGFVGGFSARTITVVSDELPDNISHIKAYVGFAGATEEVLLGQFYIDTEDIEYDDIKNTYKFVAYDKATMFDIQYEPLTLPATGLELIDEIATRLEVEVESFSLPFNGYTFNELNIAGDDVISYRQVVSRYAQLNLATAHITADGKLSFKSAFTQSPVATIDGVDYTDLKITKDIRPINALVYNQESVEDPVYVRDETSIDTYGLNELRLEDNLFLDLLDRTERQSIVATLFDIVDGYTYYPFSTKLFIRPDLDAMDIISIQDTSDVVYNTVLENMSWTWNGGLKGAMECNILPETLTDYTLSQEEYDALVMGVKVNRVEGNIIAYVSGKYVSNDDLDEYKGEVTDAINTIELTPGPAGENASVFSDVPPEDTSKLWLDISDNTLKQFMIVEEDGEQVEGWYPVTYRSEQTLSARLQLAEDSITQEVSERQDLEGVLRSEISSEVSQLSDSVTTTISNLAQGLDATDAEISEIKTYFRIDGDGILLGKSDNPIEFYAEPDEVGFKENGVRIAYWKEGTMHVDNLIAILTIIVGYHQIEKYDSPIVGKTTVVRRSDV